MTAAPAPAPASRRELARLYWNSAWTQQKIADKEGKSQATIDRWLRFGRFLEFTPTWSKNEKLPVNLTEGRFRSYWQRVPDTFAGNERQRFSAVARLMEVMMMLET